MYTIVKNWDEMMRVVKLLELPSCLSVSYDPDNDEIEKLA